MRNNSVPPPLHELESEVMDEVWNRGRATVRDVLEELNLGPKQRAYTTVMTIMTRLARKGLLTRVRDGKTDVYSPVMSRTEYADARASAEVDALVEEFGEVALVHFARQVCALDPARRDQLRALARDED
jgi:predicted transcriptional regulator